MALLFTISAKPAYQFQFANYFGSHMVLQRAPSQAVVWGYGPLTKENHTISLVIEGANQIVEHKVPIINTSKCWSYFLNCYYNN